jgi:hypothetical protein
MTIDERIERLEHSVAGHIEQAKKDYAENRQLWREMRDEAAAIWKATDRRWAETDRRFAELREEQAERDRLYKQEQKERDQIMDKRVGDLVSAIGDLCRRLDAQASH